MVSFKVHVEMIRNSEALKLAIGKEKTDSTFNEQIRKQDPMFQVRQAPQVPNFRRKLRSRSQILRSVRLQVFRLNFCYSFRMVNSMGSPISLFKFLSDRSAEIAFRMSFSNFFLIGLFKLKRLNNEKRELQK